MGRAIRDRITPTTIPASTPAAMTAAATTCD
jgi:hypothetical protein